MGVLRVYGPGWVRRLVSLYVLVFQGTPLLVQLFVIYYGLPQLGITFDRFPAAYIALGLHSAAYQAEYLRGALQSVSEGQMTAARAIGMSRLQAITNIILPQALRLMLPAWSNEVVSMIKYTAVVYLIAVPDLMGQAKNLSSKYFQPIPIYLTAAVFYLILVGHHLLYPARDRAPGAGARAHDGARGVGVRLQVRVKVTTSGLDLIH